MKAAVIISFRKDYPWMLGFSLTPTVISESSTLLVKFYRAKLDEPLHLARPGWSVLLLAALARPLIDWRQPATIGRPDEPASAEMRR